MHSKTAGPFPVAKHALGNRTSPFTASLFLRTLEPDKSGKAKKQVAKEFLRESHTQYYHGEFAGAAELQK